jgi:hypothetical protein
MPHPSKRDGYPPEWHATIKHAVRAEAGQPLRPLRAPVPQRRARQRRMVAVRRPLPPRWTRPLVDGSRSRGSSTTPCLKRSYDARTASRRAGAS